MYFLHDYVIILHDQKVTKQLGHRRPHCYLTLTVLKSMAIVEHNSGIFIQLLVIEFLLSNIKNDLGIITFTNDCGEKSFCF
jgi:hypothetical protein